MSPDDRPGAVRRKVDEYLLRGTPMVLAIDPKRRVVTVHRAGAAALTLAADDTLDISDVVPGFSGGVAEIFD